MEFQMQRNCSAQLLLAVLALAAAAATAAASTQGYISPPSKVPDFNPAAWNQAYKLTLKSVPATSSSKELLQSLRFPNTMLRGIQLPQDCSSDGFDTASPAGVALVSMAAAQQHQQGWPSLWLQRCCLQRNTSAIAATPAIVAPSLAAAAAAAESYPDTSLLAPGYAADAVVLQFLDQPP